MSFYIQQYLNNLATANAHQISPMATSSCKPKKTLEEKRLQSRIKYRNRVANESAEQRQRRLERDRTRHQIRYRQKKVQEQMLEALKSNPNMSMAQAQNLLAQLPNTTVTPRNSNNAGSGCSNSHNHHHQQHQHNHFQQHSAGGVSVPNPIDFLQLCTGSNDSSTDSSHDTIDPFKIELRRTRNAAKYYRRLMNESEEQRRNRLEKDRIRHKLKYLQQKQEKMKMGLLGNNAGGCISNNSMHSAIAGNSSSVGGMSQSSDTSAFSSMSTNNNNGGANHSHQNGHPSNVSTFTSMYSKLHPAFPSTHFSNSFVPVANHQGSTSNSSGLSNRYNLRGMFFCQLFLILSLN